MRHAPHSLIVLACALTHLLGAPDRAAAQRAPRTTAEASGYTRTSTHASMVAFVSSLTELPNADRLRVGSAGTTSEGRDLLTVTVGNPVPAETTAAQAGERLRVLINANIHGGEVEGKEAVLALLREFAQGRHAELLEHAVVVFLPIYNADGNDDIDRSHRVSQNGPYFGVGNRPNAQGLDLNRDFIKVESAECRGLLALANRWDPHLFMDLHTTNGSAHGYHLTYSPSLSTNVDAELDGFVRDTFLPEVRAATLGHHGFRVFDYGNFSRRGEKAWSTYDHRPRFGTNYMGLRNRVSVLSESFSYVPFESRVAVTRAFVLENLRAAVAHADEITQLCARADQRVIDRDPAVRFPWDTRLIDGRMQDVLVGTLSSIEMPGLGKRRIVGEEFHPERMLLKDGFVSLASSALPAAWAIPAASQAVQRALDTHGLDVRRLTAVARVEVQAFRATEVQRAGRLFQGHHAVRLTGEWENTRRELPIGTLLIRADQRWARVAAQLLEPHSEDSLATWNFFEVGTEVGTESGTESGSVAANEGGSPPVYPVLRLESIEGLLMDGD